MKQVVVASNNAGKLREIAAILAPLGLDALPQSRFDVPEAEDSQHNEPDQHNGAEESSDTSGPKALGSEQNDQDAERDRDDVRLEHRRDELQPLHRRKDRDRRGDDRVAIEKCRPGDAQKKHHHRAPPERVLGQRQEREGAALAVIVGPHQEHDVFAGHDEDECPEQERRDPEHLRTGNAVAGGVHQSLAEGVERARADVAEHDAKRGKPERGKARRRGPIARLRLRVGAIGGIHTKTPEVGRRLAIRLRLLRSSSVSKPKTLAASRPSQASHHQRLMMVM